MNWGNYISNGYLEILKLGNLKTLTTTLEEYSFKGPNSELLAQPYMTEVSSIPRKGFSNKGFEKRKRKILLFRHEIKR